MAANLYPGPCLTYAQMWPLLQVLLPTVPASLSLTEQGFAEGSLSIPASKKAEILIGHLTRVLSASCISQPPSPWLQALPW